MIDRPKKVIEVMWYGGGGGWFVLTVIMILFWGLLIAGGVALVHYFSGARSHQPGRLPPGESGGASRRAEDLLAERFARGEIDEDEYQRRLATLREHR
ncbi:SHOCT domain-containing protein [Streptomyces sp. CG1]|uniref:SHOCT domain-containing protein n=1 Tax=Streptomyces sp. CG1 TaxID=1287523 RepID=UPI0034E22FA3